MRWMLDPLALPYLTMLVNSSSTANSTGGRSEASMPWLANTAPMKSKIASSESRLRAKLWRWAHR